CFEEGDLSDLFFLLFRNNDFASASTWQKFRESCEVWGRRIQQLNSQRTSARNVSHHYDLSGIHYDLFLDSNRQYSCAYFSGDTRSLEEAQERKMELIVKKLLLRPGHRVLDIGCGWGGL